MLYIRNEVLQELQKLITAFRYHNIFLGHVAFKVIYWPYKKKESILLRTLQTPILIQIFSSTMYYGFLICVSTGTGKSKIQILTTRNGMYPLVVQGTPTSLNYNNVTFGFKFFLSLAPDLNHIFEFRRSKYVCRCIVQ